MEILLVPKSLHALDELHQQQVEHLKKQRMAPIPLILEQQFNDKISYVDISLVVPRAQGNHVDVQLEARLRTILSAVNTLTTAIVALVEENKSGVSKTKVHELQQKLLQEKLLKDQLQSQQADLQQQLDREKELVKHFMQEVDRLRERNKAIHKIQKMRTAELYMMN